MGGRISERRSRIFNGARLRVVLVVTVLISALVSAPAHGGILYGLDAPTPPIYNTHALLVGSSYGDPFGCDADRCFDELTAFWWWARYPDVRGAVDSATPYFGNVPGVCRLGTWTYSTTFTQTKIYVGPTQYVWEVFDAPATYECGADDVIIT